MSRRQRLSQLVRQVQDGEEGAFEAFVRETQEPAYRLACSLLRDPDLAQDALQEAYLAAYSAIHQLRDPEAAHSWTLRIVTYQCRRFQRRTRPGSLEAMADGGHEPSTPAESEGTEQRLDLGRAFDELNEQDRTVLTLREVMQLSYDEMARALKVPLGTVRSRLAKARLRFAKALQGERNR
ncbi:MAG: sigma-70 family RNA polymerase sigma factor [Candidatus Eremiobacteraeota bacterium]|nr:sigma-70 family RNA polymerase sigma factor [Candidatus Eremiobacteraeota bacterium]